MLEAEISGGAQSWPEIQAFLASVPIGGGLQVRMERSLERHRAYLALGDDEFDAVIREGGQVVGFAHARIEPRLGLVHGRLEPVKMLLLGDARIAPQWRRRGVLRLLLETVRTHALAKGWNHGWGLINVGNTHTRNILMANTAERRTRVVTTFVTSSVFLWRQPRAPKRAPLVAFSPTASDWEDIARAIGGRFLSPASSPARLALAASHFPEMRFYRRVDDGAFVTALWNPVDSRQLYLTNVPVSVGVGRALWNSARPLTGAQRFPDARSPLHTVELAFTVREHLSADVLAQLAFEAHATGGHVLNIVREGLAPNERLALPGPATHMETHLYTLTVDGSEPPAVPEGMPIYLDLAGL